MKLGKTLFSAVLLLSSMLGGMALSDDKGATMPMPQTEKMVEDKDKAAEKVVIGDKLNINTATAAEIQKALIGIGAKKAEAIVQYREKHGAFTAAEQLMEVQGIGRATLDKNRDRIVF